VSQTFLFCTYCLLGSSPECLCRGFDAQIVQHTCRLIWQSQIWISGAQSR
jgi:hypothetical protein